MLYKAKLHHNYTHLIYLPIIIDDGFGPQNDQIRIYNYVRAVRDGGVVAVEGSDFNRVCFIFGPYLNDLTFSILLKFLGEKRIIPAEKNKFPGGNLSHCRRRFNQSSPTI